MSRTRTGGKKRSSCSAAGELSQSCQRRTSRDHFWGAWTRLNNGLQFALEPGMPDGMGGLLHRFGTPLSGCRSQPGEQFGGFSWQGLVGPTCGLAFGLPGRARRRNTLRGTPLVFAPQVQAEPLGGPIGALNYRFFPCV
jgi:hypothetical protein